jgi:hypothetical protein
MKGGRKGLKQPTEVDKKQIDCVEIYPPKTIEFLAELYKFLREKTTNPVGSSVLDGFSIYEVDGVFKGEKTWEQRTLVIRLLLPRKLDRPLDLLQATIVDLGREIANTVAVNEEQIWICHYVQSLRVFKGIQQLAK